MAIRSCLAMCVILTWAVAHADEPAQPPVSDAAAKIVAASHFKKGQGLMEQKRFDQAAHEFDLAVISYPSAVDIYRERGFARFNLKNYQGSVEDFDRYLAAVPKDSLVLFERGLAKSLQTPEDKPGACADFLEFQKSHDLEKMGLGSMGKYCQGQVGWPGT